MAEHRGGTHGPGKAGREEGRTLGERHEHLYILVLVQAVGGNAVEEAADRAAEVGEQDEVRHCECVADSMPSRAVFRNVAAQE